jgi:GDP-L-fucose synthase
MCCLHCRRTRQEASANLTPALESPIWITFSRRRNASRCDPKLGNTRTTSLTRRQQAQELRSFRLPSDAEDGVGHQLSQNLAGAHVLATLVPRRILLTGGSGFLGSGVARRLRQAGCVNLSTPRHAEFDLVDRAAVRDLYRRTRPELVIHLAARVGGIGANQERPAEFFHDNLAMGLNMIEEGRRAGVAKFVQVGTVCSYPNVTPTPFREDDLWDGYPEPTNAPYGIAKKALLAQLQAYRRQYGFNGIYLLPANLFGPGDGFDLDRSHVIPAVIRKCVEAEERGDSEIVLWGTGAASREFLFVDDCAEAVCLAAAVYDGADPVNVGSGREITIRDLAALIVRLTGFKGSIRFDPSRPDGQPRRVLDVSRARSSFGFEASTPFEDGLRRTIDWYRAKRCQRDG